MKKEINYLVMSNISRISSFLTFMLWAIMILNVVACKEEVNIETPLNEDLQFDPFASKYVFPNGYYNTFQIEAIQPEVLIASIIDANDQVKIHRLSKDISQPDWTLNLGKWAFFAETSSDTLKSAYEPMSRTPIVKNSENDFFVLGVVKNDEKLTMGDIEIRKMHIDGNIIFRKQISVVDAFEAVKYPGYHHLIRTAISDQNGGLFLTVIFERRVLGNNEVNYFMHMDANGNIDLKVKTDDRLKLVGLKDDVLFIDETYGTKGSTLFACSKSEVLSNTFNRIWEKPYVLNGYYYDQTATPNFHYTGGKLFEFRSQNDVFELVEIDPSNGNDLTRIDLFNGVKYQEFYIDGQLRMASSNEGIYIISKSLKGILIKKLDHQLHEIATKKIESNYNKLTLQSACLYKNKLAFLGTNTFINLNQEKLFFGGYN